MKLSPMHRKIALAIALLVIVVFLGFALWIRYDVNHARAHNASGRVITIEPRETTARIITDLHQEGIIKREFTVWLYLRLFARGSHLRAGDYTFKSPISPLEAIRKIERGEVATRQFTVPEGYNKFDIARVISSLPGLKEREPRTPDEALRLLGRPELITDIDSNATSLEGYLFPDTYDFTATSTREQIVEMMVRRFRKTFTPEMQRRASDLNLSIPQVVTLASLIEKEAKVDSERELISSVFHQRLKVGMPLACDPTVIYAALLEGRYRGKIYQSDLDRNSPYNTYKRTGLPPGPIASPGKRSLEAALNPAATDYLYFVVDAQKNDGSHKFSSSSADHERAVAALRQLERQSSR
jgi:UPF0755 protein